MRDHSRRPCRDAGPVPLAEPTDDHCPIVYDVRLNLKTTACKTATISANQNPFRPAAGGITYRAPSTLAIQGLIWACGCDYLSDMGVQVNRAANWAVQPVGVDADADNALDNWNWGNYYVKASAGAYNPAVGEGGIEGYVFWNAKTKAPWGFNASTVGEVVDRSARIGRVVGGVFAGPAYAQADMTTWRPRLEASMPCFSWLFLQRFGARAEKVEGAWTLRDVFNGRYQLVGAGFGTNRRFGEIAPVSGLRVGNVTANTLVPADGRTDTDVANMADVDDDGDIDDQDAYKWTSEECGEAIISSMGGNVAGFVSPGDNDCVFCGGAVCGAYPFCRCYVSAFNENATAAYGTWTLKFNGGLSTRLRGAQSITDVYGFSAATAAFVRWLEANAQ